MNKVCFYHDDLDGYCSAAIVYNYYTGKCDLEFHKINHGEVEFLNNFKGFEEVIFVDFTPSLEYVKILANNNNTVLILDHHKTVQDRLDDINNIANAKCVLDITHAGCMVTWNYFYPQSQYKEIPLVVKLIEDYDIWKWEYPETEDFVNGMDLELWKTKPWSCQWSKLLDGTGDIFRLIDFGHTITDYKKVYNYQLLEAISYEVMFQGHKILVCNAPKNNSKLFGDKIKDYPFVAMYSHKQDQYIVSLYSATGFDTTTISAQMVDKNGNRGGGHPGASGFKCVTLPWIPIKEGN